MAATIERARKGNMGAMKSLYEANKAEIMYICSSLLQNESMACTVFSRVFKNMWELILAGKIRTEDEFAQVAVRKAVMACKTQMSKKDSKAFRIPQNRNFMNTAYGLDTLLLSNDTCEMILKNLPTLHRFIYVMHTACDYSIKQIAEVLNTNADTIRAAVEAEETNVNRIAALASAMTKTEIKMGLAEFHHALMDGKEEASVPQAAAAAVFTGIEHICRPILKKARKKKIKMAVLSAVVAVIVCAIVLVIVLALRGDGSSEESSVPTSSIVTDVSKTDTVSESSTDVSDAYDSDIYADIEIQDYGTITVALDAEAAPITVANFISLAESGFYDGLTFHRIIEGFMMQGGDPNGDGTGGSDTTIIGEFSSNGIENSLSHTRGAISMARSSSSNDSASSQFFIVQEDSAYLDGDYAVFGYVTSGMEIVDAICAAANPTDDNGTIPADEQPIISSITITYVNEDSSSEAGDTENSEETGTEFSEVSAVESSV